MAEITGETAPGVSSGQAVFYRDPLVHRRQSPISERTMSMRLPQTELLTHAGQLMLEYNESTGEIHHALTETSRAMTGEECRVWVSYRGVSVSFGGQSPAFEPVTQLAGVQSVVDGLEVDPIRWTICRSGLARRQWPLDGFHSPPNAVR